MTLYLCLVQELDYDLRRQSGEGNAYVGLRLAKSTTSQEDINNETPPRKPSEETNVSDLLALQVLFVPCPLRCFNRSFEIFKKIEKLKDYTKLLILQT